METGISKIGLNQKQFGMDPADCIKQRKSSDNVPIIIDLRSTEEYAVDHLSGAYSLPAMYLEDYIQLMPVQSKIILYGNGHDDVAIEAIQLLEKNHFEDLHYVIGGVSTLMESLRADKDEVFLSDFPVEKWKAIIQQVLAEKVIPTLEKDGGGLNIQKIIADKVYIQYTGDCNGCPSSTTGELNFIKNTLGIALNHMIEVEVV